MEGEGFLLSVAVIAKDEEPNLPRLAASLANAGADEWVLVDTGSIDRTAELAAELGFSVVRWAWRDDFAAARNEVLSHCSGRFSLIIDADEELVAEPGILPKALLEVPEGCNAATLAVKNFANSRMLDAEATIWESPRLLRTSEVRYRGRLHELPLTLDGAALTTHQLPRSVSLQHTGYTDEEIARKGKLERNVRVARLALGDEPEDPDRRIHLGQSLLWAGQPAEASVHLQEAFPYALEQGHAFGMSASISASLLLGEAQQAVAQAEACRERWGLPDRLRVQYAQALILASRGAEALAVLSSTDGPRHPNWPNEAIDQTVHAGCLRALALSLLGESAAAVQTLLDTGALAGDNAQAAQAIVAVADYVVSGAGPIPLIPALAR